MVGSWKGGKNKVGNGGWLTRHSSQRIKDKHSWDYMPNGKHGNNQRANEMTSKKP